MDERDSALPEATTMLVSNDEMAIRLGARCLTLLNEHIGDDHILFLARTRTRVDIGSWFGKRCVWAVCTASSLIMLAPGKRPYFERVPFEQLNDSQYNHVTAELVLAPIEDVSVTRLRMPPFDAAQVLAQIHN